MKGLAVVGCASTVLAVAVVSAAPQLQYDGTEAGGTGLRDYSYVLQIGKGDQPILDLRVTTNDLDQKDYADVLVPEGWSFAIESGGPLHSGGACTPIGDISPGAVRMVSIAQVRWWTDDPKLAVESFTFGFNHPWYAQDVGWRAQTEKDVFTEDWEAPVGGGAGPAHGPYSAAPEPATLSLLALGGLAVLRRRQ